MKLTEQQKYKGRQKTVPTFSILRHSLLITFLILLFYKKKSTKRNNYVSQHYSKQIIFNKFLGDPRFKTK